jgi:crossover junction endodeoxyribonuclease RuvC
MLVLGVDPGTARTGYGLVAEGSGRLRALDWGVIATEKDTPMPTRLLAIYDRLGQLIRLHRPAALAVEEIFFNRNVRSALAVGQARGVVLLTAAEAGLPVLEYTPPQVKQAVTGYGGAGKAQLQAMVKLILGLGETPRPDDAADALAVAICCIHSRGIERLLDGGGRAEVGRPSDPETVANGTGIGLIGSDSGAPR